MDAPLRALTDQLHAALTSRDADAAETAVLRLADLYGPDTANDVVRQLETLGLQAMFERD